MAEITYKEFMEQLRVIAEAQWKIDPNDVWYMYVNPSIMKYHPKVRYQRQYDRRGERMERRKKKGKRV
jgi:hypothetical protein